MKKRDEKTIFSLILQIAKNDENIRAVILNGSRASPSSQKDEFQDFDIIYIVNEVAPLVEHR
jgi:aminoglycoside 6-adenylyltransferase